MLGLKDGMLLKLKGTRMYQGCETEIHSHKLFHPTNEHT